MPEIDGLRTHGADDHARDHLDGICEECGTNHRVIESLPNQPIDPEKIEALESQENVVLARAIVSIPGRIVGADAEKVCEDAVLATQKTVRTLTRYNDEGGWIVKQELQVPDDQTPEAFATAVYEQVADEFSHIDEDEIEQSDLVQ